MLPAISLRKQSVEDVINSEMQTPVLTLPPLGGVRKARDYLEVKDSTKFLSIKKSLRESRNPRDFMRSVHEHKPIASASHKVDMPQTHASKIKI